MRPSEWQRLKLLLTICTLCLEVLQLHIVDFANNTCTQESQTGSIIPIETVAYRDILGVSETAVFPLLRLLHMILLLTDFEKMQTVAQYLYSERYVI